jgi:Flp pilus assembly protein TadG
MKAFRSDQRHRLNRFGRAEDGAVSVEAVLWLPIFIIFFALLVDATMIMSGQSQALRVVQDANRGASIGMLRSSDEIESFIQNRLRNLSNNVTVNVTPPGGAGIITTNVTIPSRDLVASGVMNVFSNFDVIVGSQHRVEF